MVSRWMYDCMAMWAFWKAIKVDKSIFFIFNLPKINITDQIYNIYLIFFKSKIITGK